MKGGDQLWARLRQTSTHCTLCHRLQGALQCAVALLVTPTNVNSKANLLQKPFICVCQGQPQVIHRAACVQHRSVQATVQHAAHLVRKYHTHDIWSSKPYPSESIDCISFNSRPCGPTFTTSNHQPLLPLAFEQPFMSPSSMNVTPDILRSA